MSSKNPFRKSAPSEEEVTVSPPPPPPPPSVPALPQRTTSSPSSATPTSSSHGNPPDTWTIAENIDDDLPPPYTPAANAGEETVGLGPRRPFQQPPPIPPPSHHPADSRYHSNWPPPSAQPRWPPPIDPAPNARFRTQPDPRLGPAPWQIQQQYRQRQNGGGGLLGMLFDTVRDIADSVSGTHDERMLASQRANAGAYATPYSGTRTVYASPPVPPPPPPPPRPTSAPPHSQPPMVPDDGSPTRTPVPGHPLLRDGSLLVYPRDYLCVKCKNTGYKNYDPSNPCRKCWEKYRKSYTGALTYTSWSPSRIDPRMQRPLPRFLPPHLAGAGPGSSSGLARTSDRRYGPSPSSPQQLQHSRSISQPHSPGSGPSYYVVDPSSRDDVILPVPDAIPVPPGDPRLGGRLCMRCGGAGSRMVMLLDVMTCEDCGGTGRVWT